MGPHLVWAGVVLVLGVLLVRQWRMNQRLNADEQCALGRMKFDLDEARRDVLGLNERLKAVEARQSKEAIWSGDSFAKLERRLAELEPVVKALSAVPKGVPPVRRI